MLLNVSVLKLSYRSLVLLVLSVVLCRYWATRCSAWEGRCSGTSAARTQSWSFSEFRTLL